MDIGEYIYRGATAGARGIASAASQAAQVKTSQDLERKRLLARLAFQRGLMGDDPPDWDNIGMQLGFEAMPQPGTQVPTAPAQSPRQVGPLSLPGIPVEHSRSGPMPPG